MYVLDQHIRGQKDRKIPGHPENRAVVPNAGDNSAFSIETSVFDPVYKTEFAQIADSHLYRPGLMNTNLLPPRILYIFLEIIAITLLFNAQK